jgi:hypothetical protein
MSLLMEIADYLCANGVCGGDQSSAPCETARGLAAGIIEVIDRAYWAAEVAAIADLIFKDWAACDDIASKEVLAAAYRIYNAGYRKVAERVS